MKFDATRLSTARQRGMLNKKGFAELVGVTPHTVSRWEAGATIPDDDTIEKIAESLNFPKEFFFGPDLDIPDPILVSFRSQTSMTAARRDAALSAGSLGFLIADWVDERFDLPSLDVSELSDYSPEIAASMLRQDWNLGEKSVSNSVHLLESKGVRVFSLAENSKKVNAFSLWREDVPFVFLNTMKTAENSRFDAAHELGHLVLHRDGKTTGRMAEEEANRFASHFLIPQSDLLSFRKPHYSIEWLIDLKARWKVSLAALCYRMHKEGLLSDWRYRDLCIQIRSRFKDTEPNGIAREKSVVWGKVMQSLWAEKITQLDIAKDLALPHREVSALIFGVLSEGVPPSSASQDRKFSIIKNDKIA